MKCQNCKKEILGRVVKSPTIEKNRKNQCIMCAYDWIMGKEEIKRVLKEVARDE